MSCLFFLLVVSVVTVQYCQATCDSKVLKKIQELRKGQDDPNLLEGLLGDYELVFLDLGPLSSLVSSQCFKATITKDDGGFKVVYNGPATLEFKIEYKDGAIQVIDDKGETSYSAYVVYNNPDTKVIAVYTCRAKGLASITFSAVAVPSDASNPADDDVKAAEEALATVGVKGGTTTGCKI